jgi:methylated-DNA-[protein]-cysteine S-methyltransferase
MIDASKLLTKNQKLSIRLMRSSPVGPIAIAADRIGLAILSIVTEADVPQLSNTDGEVAANNIADSALEQIAGYFSGALSDFALPLNLNQMTVFQKTVLEEAARIPFGEVMTYGEVALRIGKPNAARAVGGALAHNPIAIVIPCHRVVGSDGHLHGFSSPRGLATKAALLSHEGVLIENDMVKCSFIG